MIVIWKTPSVTVLTILVTINDDRKSSQMMKKALIGDGTGSKAGHRGEGKTENSKLSFHFYF